VDVRAGIVARTWEIDGIIPAADCTAIQSLFETWAAAKAAEPDALASGSVGTTVDFSGSAAGASWTEVPCWFASAPATPRIGAKYRCSFTLVDAAQALAALQAQSATEASAEPDYGTYSLYGVTLTLMQDPDTYDGGPTVETGATGTDGIMGPLTASRMKRIQGWTTTSGAKATIQAGFESAVGVRPSTGTWFPTAAPTFERQLVAGVWRQVVTMDLREIK
jgi:hypothetical protein